MVKFAAGFVTCWYFDRNLPKIIKLLQDTLAKLELKQDLLEHDNPELGDSND